MAALAESPHDSVSPGWRVPLLVVHDSEVLRLGLRVFLGSQEWVERCLGCDTLDQAVELTRRFEPRVALVGNSAGGVAGAEICRRLRLENPPPRVVLCDALSEGQAAAARAAGAVAVMTVDRPAEHVASGLLEIALGRTVAEREPDAREDVAGLTRREVQVLRGMARGQTNQEIAGDLYLSPHTIKDCSREVYRKLQARNRAQAVVRAQALGVL